MGNRRPPLSNPERDRLVFVHVAAREPLREQAHVASHPAVSRSGHEKTNILNQVVGGFHPRINEVVHRAVGLVANRDIRNGEVLRGGGDDGNMVVDGFQVAYASIDDTVEVHGRESPAELLPPCFDGRVYDHIIKKQRLSIVPAAACDAKGDLHRGDVVVLGVNGKVDPLCVRQVGGVDEVEVRGDTFHENRIRSGRPKARPRCIQWCYSRARSGAPPPRCAGAFPSHRPRTSSRYRRCCHP